MTVQQLIEELEGMNPEAEVRFASQPNWPFEYEISNVSGFTPDGEETNDEESEVVYLVEGYQLGYLPEKVKFEIGW
ncbi:MAG: hypothetical protein Q8J88_00950 [Bacteroidales bacterium]|nr:hypothetical protein [Bacteroidales bacterium]